MGCKHGGEDVDVSSGTEVVSPGIERISVASRAARTPAAKQHAASRPQQAHGKNAPSVTLQRAKKLQWRPKNTPRIEKDDIIVVLKPRETLNLKATFGSGQAGAAVRSILGADASVGLAVWPIWDQNVLVCTLKSVDAAERLLRDITLPVGGCQLPFRGHPKLSSEFRRGVVHVSQDETSETTRSKLSAEPNVVSVRKLGDTPVSVITFAGTKWAIEQILAHDRSLAAAQAAAFSYLLLLTAQRNTNTFRAASSAAAATSLELPAPTAKTGPKKAPAAKSNKPEPKKTHTGHSTNAKPGTPSEPPVLVKDFPPLTPSKHRTPAAKQHAASRPQQAHGKNAPSVTLQRAKKLQWRPKNTPRIEKDDIIVVLKLRETLDLKATFGSGQAGAAVRRILGADASVGLAVWPIWDQNVLVCTLKSVDAAERLLRDITLPVGGCQLPFRGHPKLSGEFRREVVHVSQDETSETVRRKLSAEPNVVSVRKLGGTPVAVITFAGTKVTRTVLPNCEWLPVRLNKKTVPACPLCGTVGHRADTCPRPQPGRCTSCGVQLPPLRRRPQDWNSGLCWVVPAAGQSGIPTRIEAEDNGGHKQAPTAKTGPKKAPAAKSNKPEPKKTHTGHSTNAKPGTPSEPPVLVKDFPPLTPVQAQVSCRGGAVSERSPSPSPTETALQQQIGELRRQNQILACKIQGLEAKQVGSSEPVQEAEADDGDDRSFLTSSLNSVSRQDADTVVGPAFITGPIGRLVSLEHKTEQLEAP
ncbi:hypothetical protein HPB50_029638 [Hyalomma asiaticum]|nr:hypothetical protein HPB50_029638 [Hyalomma asiaticum]